MLKDYLQQCDTALRELYAQPQRDTLMGLCRERLLDKPHGDLPRWLAALNALFPLIAERACACCGLARKMAHAYCLLGDLRAAARGGRRTIHPVQFYDPSRGGLEPPGPSFFLPLKP